MRCGILLGSDFIRTRATLMKLGSLRMSLSKPSLLLVGGLFIGMQSATAQIPSTGASATTSPVPPAEANYVLGVDDHVTILVFGEDALSKEYVVGPDGKISVPLIGDIPATGRTLAQVQSDVQAKLADGYIKNPQVAASISTFRPFYILGEVTRPGEYPYRDGLTVTAAVATAQGFTYRAQKRFVFIKHKGDPAEKREFLDPGLEVEPGDTIRVGERYF
jgi:protein involved in polysaccharide export with SLBB domain